MDFTHRRHLEITQFMFKLPNSRLMAVAATFFLLGAPSNSPAAYEFITQFGSTGTSRGQFDAPRGVTVNHEGRIVITDAGNSRVQLCTEAGVCSRFGSFGSLSGEFDKPRGVAVSSTDRVFIADRGNDRIASCAPTGSCTDFGGSGTAIGKFESPRGIAIDGQDKIYITDTDNNRIQTCNAQGVCTSFGSLGSALGKFDSPAGIALDQQGRLVIADRGNDRIQICTSGGSCTAFGSFGTALGQFNLPAGVAVNSQDEIIVVDRFNDRIQVCTHQGSCTAFGSFGAGPGQLNSPWGVAVDSNDRIIVVDSGNDRIQVFAEPVAPVVRISSFTSTPGTIEEGQTITLNWTVTDATSCTALGGTADWRAMTPNAGGGTANIGIAAAGTYTFTLQCTDGTNIDSADADVTVTAKSLAFEMNAGLNDAWFYPVTSGQGFFINVFADIGYVSLSWFTYDTERPAEDVTANLGDPGHRWLNALGTYTGNQAVMNISISSGGVFDTPTEITEVNDGTIILTFTDCSNGTVEYDIPSIGQQGLVPIQRVVGDNIALCEALGEQAAAQQATVVERTKHGKPLLNADPDPRLEALPLANMNAGLNDAWFYPVTSGQGFFINVFADIGYVSLSWFTYDTERPAENVTANLGEPGHRWLNALGTYTGNQAVMNISISSGGVFDTPTEIAEVNDGTIILTFTDCSNGTVEYDIPSIGQQGLVPIQRVVGDNIALCEALDQ